MDFKKFLKDFLDKGKEKDEAIAEAEAAEEKESSERFQREQQEELENQSDTDNNKQKEDSQNVNRGTGFGAYGVGSYVRYRPQQEKKEPTRQEQDEVLDTEVVEVYEDELKGLGGGYVEGEIIEEGDLLTDPNVRLLSPVSAEDEFIEGDWEDVSGEEKNEEEQPLLNGGEEWEDNLVAEVKNEIGQFAGDKNDYFGLEAAKAFTDLAYENDDADQGGDMYFTNNTTILDNDFVPDQKEFVATSFEDQGIASPIYPSQAMPWGAPSETSGFGSNYDESFEAEFALGGDI